MSEAKRARLEFEEADSSEVIYLFFFGEKWMKHNFERERVMVFNLHLTTVFPRLDKDKPFFKFQSSNEEVMRPNAEDNEEEEEEEGPSSSSSEEGEVKPGDEEDEEEDEEE